MNKLEEFLKKKQENTITEEEFRAWALSLARPGEPYRLELLWDEEKQTATLQADQRGMEILQTIVSDLARQNAVIGRHLHLDKWTYLTKNEINLIIKRVEEVNIPKETDDEHSSE